VMKGQSKPESGEEVTAEEQIEQIGFGRFQMIAVVAFVCFIVADGMELVVTNITWSVLPRDEWGASDYARGVLVSVSFFGFVLGALIGGFTGDVYGRLPLLYAHSIIFIPTSVVSALSQSLLQLVVTRFIVGVSMGLVLPTAVSMISEFTPQAYRGRAVILLPGIAYTLGQVLVLLLGIGLISTYGYHCLDCQWWRWMLLAGIVPDLTGIVLVYLYIPESPRFLLYQGKLDKVAEVLKEMSEINGTSEKLVNGGRCKALGDGEELVDLWKSTQELCAEPLVRTVPLAVLTWCFLSVTLFTQVFMWPIYVETLGFDHVTQYWLMTLVALVEIPGVILLLLLVDARESAGKESAGKESASSQPQLFLGRRMLTFYLAAASVCALLLHLFLRMQGPIGKIIGNVLLRLFSVLPYEMMYLYVAERVPTSHRNISLSLGNASTKLIAGILPLALLPLKEVNESAPFVLALVCAFSGAVLVWVSPEVQSVLTDSAPQVVSETYKLRLSEKNPLLAKQQ